MTKKECPSCAMEIDAREDICPICQYEFAETQRHKHLIKIIVFILLLVFILTFVLS